MKFYKAVISDDYQYFQVESLDVRDKLQKLNGPLEEEFNLLLATKDRSKKGEITLIDDSSFVLFSDKARNVYKEFCNFIPIKKLDGYNLLIPEVVDGLDFDKSEIDFFRGTQDIKRIRKYVFNKKVEQKNIFKLAYDASPVFFSENFIIRYKESGFMGLNFVEIK